MSRHKLAALALLVLLAGACSAPRATLRLSISAAPQVTGVNHLRVFALVPGTSQRFVHQATVTGRDLHIDPYVLELDVATDFAAAEASVAVLGDGTGDVVASAFVRVPLGPATTHDVTLAAIAATCDADGDGFKPCAIKASCCSALEAELAADCDDADALVGPFAEAPACRACDQITACHAWEPDATETVDAIEPRPEPNPEPPADLEDDAIDAREPSPEALDVAEPPADIAEPPADTAEPPADTAEPPADVADPPPDVPVDVPPETSCVCSIGSCCDGCHFRSVEAVCATAVSTTTVCDGAGCGANVREIVSDRHCPGNGAACNGDLAPRPSTLKQDCPADQACTEAEGAHCAASQPCADQFCPSGMLLVPTGPFWMGCNATLDDQCDAKEFPQHEVQVPRYCVDIFEVTKGDYTVCANTSACTGPGANAPCVWGLSLVDDHPINCVTWSQAQAYCEWSGKRLCSEAEWEKAARGGCETYLDDCQTSVQVWPWGGSCPAAWGNGCTEPAWEDGTARANCAESICHDGHTATSPVDAFWSYPSPYDLASMAGNVAEWVADCSHGSYDTNADGTVDAPSNGSAWTTGCEGTGRLVRGGSYASALPYYLRASARNTLPADNQVASAGIRCCKSLAP